MQELILLVGLPGSGKSTLCKEYPNHFRISQDELGNRQNCIKETKKAIDLGLNVIIDRTNIDKKQRRHWIDLVKKLDVKVTCIVLNVPAEVCVERISKRIDHPNLDEKTNIDKIKQIVNNFKNGFEFPIVSEDIDEIIVINFPIISNN